MTVMKMRLNESAKEWTVEQWVGIQGKKYLGRDEGVNMMKKQSINILNK